MIPQRAMTTVFSRHASRCVMGARLIYVSNPNYLHVGSAHIAALRLYSSSQRPPSPPRSRLASSLGMIGAGKRSSLVLIGLLTRQLQYRCAHRYARRCTTSGQGKVRSICPQAHEGRLVGVDVYDSGCLLDVLRSSVCGGDGEFVRPSSISSRVLRCVYKSRPSFLIQNQNRSP